MSHITRISWRTRQPKSLAWSLSVIILRRLAYLHVLLFHVLLLKIITSHALNAICLLCNNATAHTNITKSFQKTKEKIEKHSITQLIHCCQTNTHFSGREGNTVALFVTKRKNWSWVMLWVWILIPEIVTWLACVASVSARVRQEHWDERNKKKEWQGRGRGRGEKETLALKPHDFEKLCSPTNSAFDWLGAGSVDYLAPETSIKAEMFCWRASQIWSDVICGRRLQMLWSDIYLNHVCAKVYQIWVPSIKSIIGDRAVETSEGQFIGNDGVRIWVEKMDCLLEITST